jgi:hypothetical protein
MPPSASPVEVLAVRHARSATLLELWVPIAASRAAQEGADCAAALEAASRALLRGDPSVIVHLLVSDDDVCQRVVHDADAILADARRVVDAHGARETD